MEIKKVLMANRGEIAPTDYSRMFRERGIRVVAVSPMQTTPFPLSTKQISSSIGPPPVAQSC